jgi:predicted DsbA family dithiol-disulfide isomerase
VLLLRAREQGRDFDVAWRYFSLTQVNNKEEGWSVWEAPASGNPRGQLAFSAAEAARRQGAFDRLHMPLLEARHVHQRKLEDRDVVLDIAKRAGLDMDRFEKDLDAPNILERLARDHTSAVREHAVFGTPTFVFPEGAGAYVRVRPAPEGKDALELFDELTGTIERRPYVLEIKRPVKADS